MACRQYEITGRYGNTFWKPHATPIPRRNWPLVTLSCEAWEVVTEWTLPVSEAEKTLLTQQLEYVTMYPDEDPKTFFTRVDKLVNMRRRVRIPKTEEQSAHIIVRQLTDEYIVQKAIIHTNRAEYPRVLDLRR